MHVAFHIFQQFQQDLLLLFIPLPKIFAIRINRHARHAQAEHISGRNQQITALKSRFRRTGIIHSRSKIERPRFSRIKPFFGKSHHGICGASKSIHRQNDAENRKKFLKKSHNTA